MSMRGEICRVLDHYKSGRWDRDRAVAQLEKYILLKLSENKL